MTNELVPNNLIVSSNDLWVMLLSTVRYSMGRKTYMSSLAGKLVMRYKDALSIDQIIQIRDEVQKEIILHQKLNDDGSYKDWLGNECDYQSWIMFKERLTKFIYMFKKEEEIMKKNS